MSTESKWDIEYGDFPEAGRIEGDGFTVRIMYDECPESPRDMGDCHVGHMLCAYRGYSLGDEQASQPFDTTTECPVCEGSCEDEDHWEIRDYHGYGYTVVAVGFDSFDSASAWCEAYMDPDDFPQASIDQQECPKCEGEGEIVLGIYDYLKKTRGATVVLPLFLYDHSGISMSCGSNMGSTESRGRNPFDSAGWDTSMVGFIFDTPETREMTGIDPEHIEEALRGEVKEYDSYLRGDVYGVVVEIPGIDTSGHMLDCWGFIGDEWAEQQARESADDAEQIVAKERAERAEWEARDVATV